VEEAKKFGLCEEINTRASGGDIEPVIQGEIGPREDLITRDSLEGDRTPTKKPTTSQNREGRGVFEQRKY